ncbi:MAG: nucleotidyl transferase AbiEii/AbiGii toxin family protein [Candidatus Moraniibacteriota bacterium]
MDTCTGSKIAWHFETMPKATKKAFDFLSKQAWLEKSQWYLAGGTALAIHTGNRKSVDLDFFLPQKDFNANQLLANFLGNKNWKTTIQEEGTIYGELFGAKISFIAYPFFVPKQKTAQYGCVKVLAPLDIAVMKVIAISQRGRKRDFFDLFWCTKNLEPLEKTIQRLKVQYPSVAHDFNHILKSLAYFTDAQADPAPEIFFKATWKEVQTFFEKEVPLLANKLIDL